MSSVEDKKEIIVLGAGVIGLTTALKIQETGRYKVTILAEIFPTDPKNIKYASQWAGAHHVSFKKREDPYHHLDVETIGEMWRMSEEGSDAEACFMRLEQTEFFSTPREVPSPLAHMPEFRTLDPERDALCPGAVAGETFKTVTIDSPVYLNYLLARFLARGGRTVRGSVQHISQVAENGVWSFLPASERTSSFSKSSSASKASGEGEAGPRPPAALVVCVGLGARYLGGVEDTDVYPIRGQTVMLNAPWVKWGRTLSDLGRGWWTYVIPRRSGVVVLGGTLEADDWNATPRPATTKWILERILEMAPEIVPLDMRKNPSGPPTLEDIQPLIIEEGCGLRPARKGGIRLETGTVPVPGTEGTIPVVYNYGHAGAGYISSIGSARVALELLDKALGRSD